MDKQKTMDEWMESIALCVQLLSSHFVCITQYGEVSGLFCNLPFKISQMVFFYIFTFFFQYNKNLSEKVIKKICNFLNDVQYF